MSLSSTVARAQNFHHHHPSKFPRRKSSISISVEVSTAASLSLKSSFDDTEDEDDSCARTDFGLESPTIGESNLEFKLSSQRGCPKIFLVQVVLSLYSVRWERYAQCAGEQYDPQYF